MSSIEELPVAEGTIDLSKKHPCFSFEANHTYGRIHLPVAPLCNIQCNFCNRQYDCVNESRPGVSSAVLKPEQAIEYLDEMLLRRPEISVLGIAGPGDPFANPEETMDTLRRARAKYPKLILCLASNGLDIAPYIDELAELQVSHVTITINTFDPRIGGKIYAWVRDNKTKTPLIGLRGAGLLIEHQKEAILKLKEKNILVKVNTIIMPGINDEHIPALSRYLQGLGVDVMNCMSLIPVKGTPFEDMEETDSTTLAKARRQAGEFIPQMEHCTHCRADAAGLLTEEASEDQYALLEKYAQKGSSKITQSCIAIASLDGLTINQNIGQATRFILFAPDRDSPSGYNLQEIRQAPKPGNGIQRWKEMVDVLSDCRAVIASAIGADPRVALGEKQIKFYEMDEVPIHTALKAIFGAEAVPRSKTKRPGCSGKGGGCGGSGC